MIDSTNSQLYLQFSALLDYPSSPLVSLADQCVNTLGKTSQQAAEEMARFRDAIANETLEWLQEIYTQTFDMQGFCCPYIGHHLFGESYKRSWFMAQLNQGYREHGFSAGAELPDHLAVVLHFLAQSEDEFGMVLRNEGVIPAVQKMLGSFCEEGGNPYRYIFYALVLIFEAQGLTGDMSPSALEKDGS